MPQKKIMLAWELGGGLGHVSRLAALAKRFIQQDCEVVLALRHLSHVPAVLQEIQCLTLQAPISLATPHPRRESVSFADILRECGYFSAKELFGLTAGWQSLYDLVKPDLLLADFAPTALLAARIYDFKTASLGGGFLSPPAVTPWPDFRPGRQASAQLLQQRETAVFDVVNIVLQAMGEKAPDRLADLLAADLHFLCTWPELDCYERPPGTPYWGPCMVPEYGQETWPHQQSGLFCYLKSDQPQAEAIVAALHSVGLPSLLYIDNLPAAWEQRYRTSNLHFAKNPVKLTSMLPHVRAVICPGGNGMIAASLLAGKPLLLIPAQSEQAANAGRVAAIGAGIDAGHAPEADIKESIERILSDPVFTQAATSFAEKYRNFSSERQIAEIVSACLMEIDSRKYTPSPAGGRGLG